jgi:3',5'-cyclic AMP phosphodiesterase CpdA
MIYTKLCIIVDVLTILHLSDLHRSPNAPVSNDMLLSCLLQDLEKQKSEDPVIPTCDVAVITGDLIMGVKADDSNFSETFISQYREAKSFLIQLSQELFDGHLGRIFVVPGNHDVCWQICRQSMELIETAGRFDASSLLEIVNSPYRWSWDDLRLYRIKDFDVYKSRLKYFKEFFDDFYKTQGFTFNLEDNEQVNNFVTEDEKILFTGFSSLFGNDCYDHRGRISSDCVARNGLIMRKSELADIPVKIAFWHHSLESSGYGIDHLNRDEVLPLLIDQGYTLGLHGHQHRSGVVSFAYHLDPERFMPVISSGSLCADQYSIPQGYRRQYNLIEIDEVECKTKIHVREWFDNTSLISARLQEFGGKGWIIKDLPLLKERIKRRLQVLEKTSPSVDKAELLLREKKYEATLDLLKKLPQDIPIVRSLLVETLHSLGRWDDLMRLIPKPLNPTELTVLVDALCKKKNFDSAISIIQECEREPLTYDTGFISSLRKRVEAEKEGA